MVNFSQLVPRESFVLQPFDVTAVLYMKMKSIFLSFEKKMFVIQ